MFYENQLYLHLDSYQRGYWFYNNWIEWFLFFHLLLFISYYQLRSVKMLRLSTSKVVYNRKLDLICILEEGKVFKIFTKCLYY